MPTNEPDSVFMDDLMDARAHDKSTTKRCDICGGLCGRTYYDARTTRGPWADMCSRCFSFNTRNGGTSADLGIGRGQRYDLTDGKNWEKTEG